MSPSDRLEIRVIKFCHDLGKTPTQMLKMIEQTKREHLVSRALVFKWHHRLAVGQDSLLEQEGRASEKETLWRDDCDVSPLWYDASDLDGRLQISKVILSYKFDFYMMHVAKVSDHSYNIVNCNNQFKEMLFRSLQELRASTNEPDCRTVWPAVVRGRVRTLNPSSLPLCRVRRILF